MRSRRLRLALAAALAAPLLVGSGAGAVSPPLSCPGLERLGPWQVVPVEKFREVEGVQTRDLVTGYSVDAEQPQRVLATNGNTVKTSGSFGCAWEDGLVLDATPDSAIPVSGAAATIVGTAVLPGGPALAALREGTGAGSRPHVAVSATGKGGSWRFSDAGLPAQGAPRLLRAAYDGRTAYLALSPVSDGGSAGGTLPALPGTPVAVEAAGALYATTDGGGSWSVRTPTGQLPAAGVQALAVDVANPDLIYIVSGGRLFVSRDGGRTLDDRGLRDVRAVETMEPGEVVIAQNEGLETGLLRHSTDGGASFLPRPAVRDMTSLAYRRGDGVLIAEASKRLFRIPARRDGVPVRVQSPLPPRPASAFGDRSPASSFTVLAEHALLRWLDAPPPGALPPPPRVGDLADPPPPPGRIAPPSQSVSLPVGESRLLEYTLVLPPSPTPLDLVFLVDTSTNMGRFIDDLKTNLRGIARASWSPPAST